MATMTTVPSTIVPSDGGVGGSGMATAGLIMGYIALGLGVCGCIVYLVLMALGLATSKRGDYARPLPKRYVGWAQPLSW